MGKVRWPQLEFSWLGDVDVLDIGHKLGALSRAGRYGARDEATGGAPHSTQWAQCAHFAEVQIAEGGLETKEAKLGSPPQSGGKRVTFRTQTG